MVKSILKSILVGIDRSSGNTPAMVLGLHWAKQFEAQLVGIGLVDESGIEVMEAILSGGLHRERPAIPTGQDQKGIRAGP